MGSDPHDEPRDVDELGVGLGVERQGLLREPLDSLPSWWGPFADGSDQQQLGAGDCDLTKYSEFGEGLVEFASSGPRRRFLVCEKLNVSRWAGVYIAIDCYADRLVVLKISRHAVDREGRLAVMASHPNVVTVHDTFVCQGHPTMVLEWCSQGTLRSYARASRDWKLVLARGVEAGRGLVHCHSRGKVHGDIKPTNILISDEVGKLSDFGIARSETQDGEVVGTPAFAPPERDFGVWSLAGDVYSYAATLAWALENFRVPRRVLVALKDGLAEDPERRPTMIEILGELERALDHEPIERDSGRRRVWAWFQGAAVVVTATVVTSWVLVAMCSIPDEPKSDVDVTLELAAKSVEDGDGQAAVHYLEAARSGARRTLDHDVELLVADEAVHLGTRLAEQGDAVTARLCWEVARDVFYDLDDQRRLESLEETAGRWGEATHSPRRSN